MFVGDAQDRTGLLLLPDCGMAGADAEVGGRDRHGHRGLAKVVLIEEFSSFVGWHWATSAIAAGADAMWRAPCHTVDSSCN